MLGIVGFSTGPSREVAMPSVDRPGKRGMYVELPEDLDAEFRAFVEKYPLGTISQHVVLAIRRHMASPPAVEVAKLPAVKVQAPPPGTKRRGRPPKS
jgi:hypothetical protein